MRIGIFLPNWVGDVVMATPALRSLRQHVGSQATLVGIMRPYVSEVLAGTPWLDESVEYDRRSLDGMRSLVRQLRRQRLDTILLLTNSFSTAALAWLSGAPRRIGFSLHGRGWLLTDSLDPPRENGSLVPHSAVDHYLTVAGVLGCPTPSKRLELNTVDKEERSADAAWRQFHWRSHDPVIALNTGGAYGAAKTWPAEHFAALARRLVSDRDVRVLFLCGPAERDSVNQIVRQIQHPHVRSLAQQPLSLGLSKACVRRSRLLVTTDSGPRHFAAAFGVPTVTMFGPTDPRWSDNFHSESINVQLDVDCSPCGKRICPLGHHRCMRDLTVEHVLVAATSLLDAAARSQAA